MQIGKMDRLITIERKTSTTHADSGRPVDTWSTFATLYCNWQDVLPSKAETQDQGIRIAKRPARVRFRYLSGLDSDMRVVKDGAVYQIVGGPAEMGRREGHEIMVEHYSSAGQGA